MAVSEKFPGLDGEHSRSSPIVLSVMPNRQRKIYWLIKGKGLDFCRDRDDLVSLSSMMMLVYLQLFSAVEYGLVTVVLGYVTEIFEN